MASQIPANPKPIPLNKRLIFALDVESPQEAQEWVSKLKDQIKFYKVGLQLFLAGWFNIVDWIVQQDLEVMVDLKFFDVPQTVASAFRQLKGHGISFTTVHGNDAILRAAVEARHDIAPASHELNILAVTVLTSLDQADLQDLGFNCSVEELVLSRARRALALGCDGVVSSGLEAPRLRSDLGQNFLIVVPGVRPVQNRVDDQKRTVDLTGAFLAGADHVVVGRPIRQADNPVAVVETMQAQIAKAFG
ncbi:MAG: orotidine-5'-phosphate decarboxylase [bacterium]